MREDAAHPPGYDTGDLRRGFRVVGHDVYPGADKPGQPRGETTDSGEGDALSSGRAWLEKALGRSWREQLVGEFPEPTQLLGFATLHLAFPGEVDPGGILIQTRKCLTLHRVFQQCL
jgi:hypothetical protein